jgi:hypothetical protein
MPDAESCQGVGCRWLAPMCSGVDSRCYSSSPRSLRAVLFASEGKHALYHTQTECDHGALFGVDACPANAYDMRDYKADRLQNIGQPAQHAAFDSLIEDPDACHLYDVWGGQKFGTATAYSEHFLYPFNWDLPNLRYPGDPLY